VKLSEVYKIADSIAPKALSDEMCQNYGWYDNSGILVNTDEEVNGILFSLDLTMSAVDEAIARGVKLIITHHPAIYGKIGNVRVGDFEPLGEKLVKCIKNGISVICMHLNLDVADGGIDESLMEGICLSSGMTIGAGMRSTQIMHPLGASGYGRVYDVLEQPISKIVKELEKNFNTKRILVYGEEKTISRISSFCGAGADEQSVAFAVANGADAIVSSDFKHHVITLANERGLALIALTNYASEQYGFEKYYQKIRQRLNIPCDMVTEENLL
jgi:dinuclear metal center YbgI/SA1388 family protein